MNDIEKIAEVISNLGGDAQTAFIVWVIFNYLATLTKVAGVIFVVGFVLSRLAKGIINALSHVGEEKG